MWGIGKGPSIFGCTQLDLDILGWQDKLACLEGFRRSLDRVTGCTADPAKFLLNRVSMSKTTLKGLYKAGELQ